MDISYSVSSYIQTLYSVYLLAPIITFIAGAIIAVIIYYTVGAKYGIKMPTALIKLGNILGKIHLPVFLAVLLYLFLLICSFWRVQLINPEKQSYYYVRPRVYQCFYNCYLNPWFYVWAAAIIAAIVLSVLGYKKKIHFSIAYIVMGISFILLYGLTEYGTALYCEYYCDVYYSETAVCLEINYIHHNYAVLTIITGVTYILFALIAVFLDILKRRKLTPEKGE